MAEPVQGWEQWARDIEDIVSLCESEQAIGLVQERNRQLLKGLSRERQDLYRHLGEAFGARRELLKQPRPKPTSRKRKVERAQPKTDAPATALEKEDA